MRKRNLADFMVNIFQKNVVGTTSEPAQHRFIWVKQQAEAPHQQPE